MSKSKKMDQKLVAAKDHHESEVKYISGRWRVPIAVVRRVMKEQGKNGKPARSRAVIYIALRLLGYKIPLTKKHKIPKQ